MRAGYASGQSVLWALATVSIHATLADFYFLACRQVDPVGWCVLVESVWIRILLRSLAVGRDDARIANFRDLFSRLLQPHPEEPIIPVIEQEQHRMPDSRKRLRDLRLLHAENAGIGIAHVDEQFISWADTHHRCGLEAAVETEGVVKIKAEGRGDRL